MGLTLLVSLSCRPPNRAKPYPRTEPPTGKIIEPAPEEVSKANVEQAKASDASEQKNHIEAEQVNNSAENNQNKAKQVEINETQKPDEAKQAEQKSAPNLSK